MEVVKTASIFFADFDAKGAQPKTVYSGEIFLNVRILRHQEVLSTSKCLRIGTIQKKSSAMIPHRGVASLASESLQKNMSTGLSF